MRVQLSPSALSQLPSSLIRVLIHRDCFRFRVISGSMSPALRPGDLVEIKEKPPGALQPGEMALLHLNGRLIGHRFVRRYSDKNGALWIVTRGDALPHEDPPVPADQVIGVITCVAGPRFFHQGVWRLKRWGSAILARSQRRK